MQLMSKNEFLDQYLDMPNADGVKFVALGIAVLMNIFNPVIVYLFENIALKHTYQNIHIHMYLTVLIIFDVLGMIMFIFAKKLSRYVYLYSATAVTITSIYYLYAACMIMFVDMGNVSVYCITISILIFLIVVLAMIFNIKSKINRKKAYPINNRNSAVAVSIGAIAGIALPKFFGFNESNLPLVIVFLLLSYCFILPSSGFHKYYLIKKLGKVNIKDKNMEG